MSIFAQIRQVFRGFMRANSWFPLTILPFGILIIVGLMLSVAMYERDVQSRWLEIDRTLEDVVEKKCSSLIGTAFAQCDVEVSLIRASAKLNIENFITQKQVMFLSYLMGLVTVVGMTMTALSLGLLRLTLLETRRTAEAAQEATLAAQEANKFTKETARPWVLINLELDEVMQGRATIEMSGRVILTNRGESPALGIDYYHDGFVNTASELDRNREVLDRLESSDAWSATASGSIMPGESVVIDFWVERNWSEADVRDYGLYKVIPFVVSILVIYRSDRVPGKTLFLTRMFEVRCKYGGSWHEGLPTELHEVGGENLSTKIFDFGNAV